MTDDVVTEQECAVDAARAFAGPLSINAEDRTVEVIWTTGKRAKNYITGVGAVLEELEVSPAAVRMGGLASGNAPVFDSHRKDSVRSQIGRVVSARIEGKRGIATLQFSAASDVEPLWQRVVDGTVRSVSVGYRIHKYQQVKAGADTVYRITDWEPFEISIVPIPADDGAVIRSAPVEPAQFVAVEPSEAAAEPLAPVEAARAETIATSTIAAPAAYQEQTMTDQVTTAAPATVAAPNAEAIRAEAVSAERARIAGIEEALRAAQPVLGEAGIAAVRAEALGGEMDGAAVRLRLFDLMAKAVPVVSGAQRVQMGASGDDPAVIRDAMAEALAVRMKSSYQPKGERFREWAGVRPSDMVRDLMAARGERDIPRNPVLLAERSFHTTSDFPLLLSSALNKVLLADYAQAVPTYRMFMARRNFNDFKAHSFLRAGDFPALTALGEGGEIQTGTISEGREQITMATYARGVRVTRQMLVNDDLGAFGDFAGMIGRRVVDYENALAFAIVTAGSGAGPNLADGNAVFTTGRGNRSASGAAIEVATLSTARASLRARTSPDGLKLNLAPRYLLTGPAYETIAWQFTSAQYVPATAATTNPFRGVYEPLVDANITGNNWYLLADPAAAPVYVYGFLNGAEGPQVRTTNPPGTDGAVQVDVWMDFACGAIDWRGGWFNAGG